MFTIGIFSTHLPYIAFVFFYAFFFLFGYQNIAEKNFSTEENSKLHELVLKTDYQFVNNKVNSDFNDFSGNFSPENGGVVFRDRKLELLVPPEKSIQQNVFELYNFSRPPPAA